MANEISILHEVLKAFPRLPLIGLLTPLSPMRKLSHMLGGSEIWCKRDDLIGFGMGGNKIRGLEFLLADALNNKANLLITGAGVQSNHVRATAAAAAYSDLKYVAVFWGKPPKSCDGNYRLTRMLGAEAVFTGEDERSSVDRNIATQCENFRQQGLNPYAIPRGGACPLGALGHVLAAFEVHQQCCEIDISPGKVVLATGSGGTHAGWLLGTRILGVTWKIESYTVSRDANEVKGEIIRLATAAAALLGLNWHFAAEEVMVHDGFIGEGYGIPSPEAAEAIRLLAHTEGILLDPTYTGKAMAGLMECLRSNPVCKDPVLFIHTGGQPAYFAGDGTWLDK